RRHHRGSLTEHGGGYSGGRGRGASRLDELPAIDLCHGILHPRAPARFARAAVDKQSGARRTRPHSAATLQKSTPESLASVHCPSIGVRNSSRAGLYGGSFNQNAWLPSAASGVTPSSQRPPLAWTMRMLPYHGLSLR